MTEEEAKKKWCPQIRDGGTYHGMIYSGINSAETERKGYDCIASDCMMWRREKDDYGDDYGKGIPDDLGYCGLAGRI